MLGVLLFFFIGGGRGSSFDYYKYNCNQDVNQIEREIRSNGAIRSNRQFRSNQTSSHSADDTYISVSLCYDFRAIHISKS